MTGSGRRRIDAFTVTGICARTPERLHGRRQAAVGQDRRRDPASEVAQLADGRARLLAGPAHELGDLGLALQALLGATELHAQGHQARLRAVVEVALDPPQLGRLDVERARAGPRELVDAGRQAGAPAGAGSATPRR